MSRRQLPRRHTGKEIFSLVPHEAAGKGNHQNDVVLGQKNGERKAGDGNKAPWVIDNRQKRTDSRGGGEHTEEPDLVFEAREPLTLAGTLVQHEQPESQFCGRTYEPSEVSASLERLPSK